MTDMPEPMLRLVETASLLVLDPSAGPIYRAIAELALGDEVLVVAAGRMCFRRIIAIEDADPPRAVVEVPAGSIGPQVPRSALQLDAANPVAAPVVPAPLRVAGHGGGVPSPAALWTDLLVDGAERVIVENLAVGVQRVAVLKPDERASSRSGRLRASHVAPVGPVEPDVADIMPSAPPNVAAQHVQAEAAIKVFVGATEISLVGASQEQDVTILRFVLPPRTTALRLASASIQPAGDSRRLGVAVVRLSIDSSEVALDRPELVRGFHSAESGEGTTWRWTDGDAMLILPPKPIPQAFSIHITNWHQLLARD